MKLREHLWKVSSKYRAALVAVAFLVLFATLILALAPVKYVSTNTQEYEVVSVFYISVVGWNTAPGDRDFYQVTWADGEGKISVGSFLVRSDSVRLADTDLVRVESYYSESLFGLRELSQKIYLQLTSETLATLRGVEL